MHVAGWLLDIVVYLEPPATLTYLVPAEQAHGPSCRSLFNLGNAWHACELGGDRLYRRLSNRAPLRRRLQHLFFVRLALSQIAPFFPITCCVCSVRSPLNFAPGRQGSEVQHATELNLSGHVSPIFFPLCDHLLPLGQLTGQASAPHWRRSATRALGSWPQPRPTGVLRDSCALFHETCR